MTARKDDAAVFMRISIIMIVRLGEQKSAFAYQARLIMATTAQGERQPGRFGARGSSTGPAGVN